MHRLLLASLPWMLACASRAPAPANRAPTATTYTLIPMSLWGGEGRHSASHTTTEVSGALTLEGGRATLAFGYDSFTSHVRCPKSWRDGTITTMQACAPDDAQDMRHVSKLVMRGDTRVDNGQVIATLRTEQRTMQLTCTSEFLGLTCAVAELERSLGRMGDWPSTMTFMTAGARKLELASLHVADVGHVSGGIQIDGAAARVALSLDGGVPAVLIGTVHGLVHERGFQVRAQTSPTRTFVARCTQGQGDAFACEVTADRSVLGKPQHVSATMIATPVR